MSLLTQLWPDSPRAISPQIHTPTGISSIGEHMDSTVKLTTSSPKQMQQGCNGACPLNSSEWTGRMDQVTWDRPLFSDQNENKAGLDISLDLKYLVQFPAVLQISVILGKLLHVVSCYS